MIYLTSEQRAIARDCMISFRGHFGEELGNRLRQIPYYQETLEIREFEIQLRNLQSELEKQPPDDAVSLDDAVLPAFKRIVMEYRRRLATDIEHFKEQTIHPELLEGFDKELFPLNDLIAQGWFERVEAMNKPRLVDYFTIEHIDQAQTDSVRWAERQYDEKFRLLQAPNLFLNDLRYYRRKCEARGVSLVVAYLDIDEFKATFNARYGEVKVDRNVLPTFMRCIEAHLYQHGFGYRYGGDEYVLLLPNMSFSFSVSFLDELREKLGQLEYRDVEEKSTVSIGFCESDSDSFLTDRELLDRANKAKTFAKKQGKNRIGTYWGPRFTESELYIVEPSDK